MERHKRDRRYMYTYESYIYIHRQRASERGGRERKTGRDGRKERERERKA